MGRWNWRCLGELVCIKWSFSESISSPINCNSTGIYIKSSSPIKLTKVIDVLGREVDGAKSEPLFISTMMEQ